MDKCKRCGKSDWVQDRNSRRCRPCKRKKDRDRRARARSEWTEHAEPGKAHPLDVAPGYHVRGQTVHAKIDRATGAPVVTQVWNRVWEDSAQKRIEAVINEIQSLGDAIPAIPEVSLPADTLDDYMLVVPLGDPHIGMYSWGEETGTDFDLKIAEQTMLGCLGRLMLAAPGTGLGILLDLGDYLHADNFESRTARGGHALDTDSRWSRVFGVAFGIAIKMAYRMLQKCRRVIVRHVGGNHDDVAAVAMRYAVAAHFRYNPRVTVDLSPNPFWYHQFGQCLVGATHGHGPKLNQLSEIMAHDCNEIWSETLHRRWYTGHVHHERVISKPSCVIETFPTTAPADAWAHAKGYRSDRDMRAHLWHKTGGLKRVYIEAP